MPCQEDGAERNLCKSPLVNKMPRAAHYVCIDIHFWMEAYLGNDDNAPEDWIPAEAGSKAMSRFAGEGGDFRLMDAVVNGMSTLGPPIRASLTRAVR